MRNSLTSPEGKVLWIGPGDCVVPPRGEVHAVCQMETDKPLRTEIFIVDTAEETPSSSWNIHYPFSTSVFRQ